MSRFGVLAIYAAVICVGCAVSEDVTNPGYTNASGVGGSVSGGAGGYAGSGDSSSTGGSSMGGSSTGGSSTGGSSTGGSSTGGSSTGGSSTGGSSTGGSSTGGSSGGSACQNAQCQQVTSSGTVSGDSGAQSVVITGSDPEWVQVRVTEDNHGLVGHKLKVTGTLDSPTGENFDLFVYVNPSSDVALECTNVVGSSTNAAGVSDTVSTTWGESGIPNGSDDSRNVSFEVRAAAGTTCDPNSSWTLTVQGN